MAAGVVPWLLPAMSVPAYILIDAAAGIAVLRHPAGIAQRAVRACFALLVMYHTGFLLSYGGGDATLYYKANVVTGWVQFALLASWGLHDVGKVILRRSGSWRGLPPDGAGIR